MAKRVWVKPHTRRRKGKIIHVKGHWREVTPKLKAAAKRNIEKARRRWKSMSHRERARRMPGGVI